MSASHRKLSRLPLEIFEELIYTEPVQPWTPQELRLAFCSKLKRFRVRSRNGGSTSISVKTVGDLFHTPRRTLLQALDPLLTMGEIELLWKRICRQCTSEPISCSNLLKRTTTNPAVLRKAMEEPRRRLQTATMSPSSDTEQLSPNSNGLIGEKLRYLPTGLDSFDVTVSRSPSVDDRGEFRIHHREGDLRGGIRVGSVTEIVGRAGAGKTQFALQLILMAAKYNQGTLYIDTEKKLIVERLGEMAAQRLVRQQREQKVWFGNIDNGHVPHQGGNADLSRCFGQGNAFSYGTTFSLSPGNEGDLTIGTQPSEQRGKSDCFIPFPFKHPSDVLRNTMVKQPNSTEDLLRVLVEAEEEILHRNQHSTFPVRLLVVDSIAAPLKRDFGADAAPQRASTAFFIAQTLKRYADQLNLAIVVINQVGLVDSLPSINPSKAPIGAAAGSRGFDQVSVRAALGTSWHHCVSTRLLLEHEEDPHQDGWQPNVGGKSQWRRLTITKSIIMPISTFQFEITPLGIVEVNSSGTPKL